MAISEYGTIPSVGLGMTAIPGPFDAYQMGQWGTFAAPTDASGNPVAQPGLGTNPGAMTFKDKAGLALAGLQTLGGLFAAFKQLSLANKQFDFQKRFANANMANSIQTYNTQLQDRARARAATEGQSQAQMQQYIDQNRMAAWNGG